LVAFLLQAAVDLAQLVFGQLLELLGGQLLQALTLVCPVIRDFVQDFGVLKFLQAFLVGLRRRLFPFGSSRFRGGRLSHDLDVVSDGYVGLLLVELIFLLSLVVLELGQHVNWLKQLSVLLESLSQEQKLLLQLCRVGLREGFRQQPEVLNQFLSDLPLHLALYKGLQELWVSQYGLLLLLLLHLIDILFDHFLRKGRLRDLLLETFSELIDFLLLAIASLRQATGLIWQINLLVRESGSMLADLEAVGLFELPLALL
jgi:hypothetical protein